MKNLSNQGFSRTQVLLTNSNRFPFLPLGTISQRANNLPRLSRFKVIGLISVMFLFFLNFSSAQSYWCGADFSGSNQFNPPVVPPDCPDGCLDGVDRPEDMDLITIKVNIHFLQDENEAGNFDLQNGSTNGIIRAQNLINQMNDLVSDMPTIVPLNYSSISDAKIRFVLHTDPITNPNDQNGGVWFHDDHPLFGTCNTAINLAPLKNAHSEYGGEVVDVFFNECPENIIPCDGNCFKGFVNALGTGSTIMICGMFESLINGNDNCAGSTYPRVMVHEMMHLFGLHHSFMCLSAEIADLTPGAECSANGDGTGCSIDQIGNNCMPSTGSGSNNVMGKGGAPIALSPCQIATARRTILTNRPAFAIITPAQQNGSPDLVIANGEDVTWTFQRDLDGNVTIEDGGKLTITTTINMAENKRITVEAGGQLKLECAHIKPRETDEFWEGIIVHGSTGMPQAYDPVNDDYYVGWCTSENSIIEQALTGIRAGKPFFSNRNGGVIRAIESEFINCQRHAVYIPDFQNATLSGLPTGNLSYFTSCEFSIDNTFPSDFANFQAMAYLKGVDGVTFRACKFVNGFPHTQPFADDRKYGIQAVNAGFRVFGICAKDPAPPDCSSFINSHFEGFAYGIHSGFYLGSKTFQVSRASFSDNQVGIYANSAPTPDINRCTFEVGSILPVNTQFNPENANRGIHLDGCTGYRVEGNTLSGATALAGTTNPVGIQVASSGEEPNEVYRNVLNDLLVGNLSNGLNRNLSTPIEGLQYRCNTNGIVEENIFDFAVPDEKGFGAKGIAGSQGSAAEAAGNTFSPVSVGADPEMHFLNKEEPFDYFRPQGVVLPSNYTVTTITLNDGTQNQCLSNLPGGGEEGILGDNTEQQLIQDYNNTSDNTEKQKIANLLIRYYLIDETGQDLSAARQWLTNKNTLHSYFTIVETYLQESDATGAQQALNNIPVQFALSGEQQLDYNHFNTLKSLQIAAVQNGTTDAQLVAANQATLIQVADAGEYYASKQAKLLLNEVNGVTYLPHVELPDMGQQNMVAPPQNNFTVAVETNQVTAVPNPAKNVTTFHYSINESATAKSLIVQSMDGRIVWQSKLEEEKGRLEWDFGTLADGVYLYSLEAEGKTLLSERLVIIR